MDATHSFKVKFNGNDWSGNIDLSKSGDFEFEIEGEVRMKPAEMQSMKKFLLELSSWLRPYAMIEELEVKIL